MMRWHWLSNGTVHPAARAVDTATHPAYRRLGLFRRLTLDTLEIARAEGIEFVFNTPNARSLPGYLAMGWRRVGRVPLLVRLLRPLGMLARGLGFRRRSEPSEAHLAAVGGLLDEPQLGAMLRAPPADVRLHTRRDEAYLRWRFADIPGVAYRAAWDLAGTTGTAVICRERPRGRWRELSVAEVLMAVGCSERRCALLLRQVLLASSADYAVACAARGTPERKALMRSGFVPVAGVAPILVVRSVSEAPGGPDPTLWQNWRMSLADLEIF